MEFFPSKAVRAFDKPVLFAWSPDTGSFSISGEVSGQAVDIIAGHGAFVEDASAAVVMTSQSLSPAEMAETLESKFRLQKYIDTNGTVPFCENARITHRQPILISDESLGDFVLEHAKNSMPFATKDMHRNNLRKAHLEITANTADLVTTDGYRLHVISRQHEMAEETTISTELPIKLFGALGLNACVSFAIYDDGGGELTCFSEEYEMFKVLWKAPAERFPPWQQVIPDPDAENYMAVGHCFSELWAIPKHARKDGLKLFFLAEPDSADVVTYAVVDGGSVVHVGETFDENTEYYARSAFNSKYIYEFGKLLKKVSPEDIAYCCGVVENSPVRADWEDRGVSYTHVLMPLRDAAQSWSDIEEDE